MNRKKAFERWGKMGNCEVAPQAIWQISKSLIKRSEPRALTAILGSLGVKFLLLYKINSIADNWESKFTPHILREGNRVWRVEARVQALLKAVENNPLK
jgi:hypothetical protein